MQKYLYIVIALLGVAAFGCDQTINVRQSGRESISDIKVGTQRSYSLGSNTPAIYMDSEALKEKFIPIFGNDYPRGLEWATELDKRVNIPINFQGEYYPVSGETFFSPEEKKALGTYNIKAGLMSPLSQSRINFARPRNFSQGYLKSLRGFLADACNNRIELDSKAIDEKKKTVIMHQRGAPSVEEINEFMAEMFGIVEDDGLLKGASDYKAAFDIELAKLRKVVAAKPDSPEDRIAVLSVYKVMCIAVGQDPRTFLR